ncbi:cysteine hydrolase [Pusillimonas sp. DMV24BSW_D]|uniref:cysteine hydrolase family protein n=1 Tax=Neopusillimonas aestuarii TaxID=2716226 RepID=UPI001408FF96|nr:isochorismatase family cysteine hydrolase [Pusillimonas sp. DMV24BSW_D]QIM47865.1 cysteine hydrolase [Pusillimonas sp. DMV24BSW_D]
MSKRAAVIALHYQNEVLHPDGKIRVGVDDEAVRERVIAGAADMLALARERRWPVMHVRIAFRPDYADCPRNTPIFRKTVELGAVKEGDWGTEFLAQLQPLDNEREFIVTHQRLSAFVGTQLDHLLRMLDVRHLVIGGVATHSVVEHTVRDAADRGYEVTIVAQACASGSPELHDAALRSLALVAQVTDVQSLALEKSYSEP